MIQSQSHGPQESFKQYTQDYVAMQAIYTGDVKPDTMLEQDIPSARKIALLRETVAAKYQHNNTTQTQPVLSRTSTRTRTAPTERFSRERAEVPGVCMQCKAAGRRVRQISSIQRHSPSFVNINDHVVFPRRPWTAMCSMSNKVRQCHGRRQPMHKGSIL